MSATLKATRVVPIAMQVRDAVTRLLRVLPKANDPTTTAALQYGMGKLLEREAKGLLDGSKSILYPLGEEITEGMRVVHTHASGFVTISATKRKGTLDVDMLRNNLTKRGMSLEEVNAVIEASRGKETVARTITSTIEVK